jgi:inorganic phosphate transporter, PiT family
MLTHLDPTSMLAVGLLVFALAMVLMFEATNGFHDAANVGVGICARGALYLITRKTVHDPHLYEPAGEKTPVWWMRAILIFTCTGVSFAHGTNDGQKSIGMIMLTIIGLFPATYALNPAAGHALSDLPAAMHEARPLIEKYGDGQKLAALDAVRFIESQGSGITRLASAATMDSGQPVGLGSPIAQQRASVRDEIYQVIAQLKHVEDTGAAAEGDKKQAKELAKQLGKSVEYAPWWVRILSALCLGIGTMIGYKRIVTTLGERLGNIHMTPAQGAAAEVVSAAVIGVAGFTGLPVSTTHIVTSGIGGTMVSAGAGLQYRTISRILMAWVFTLPVTILIAAGIYYLLAAPRLAS